MDVVALYGTPKSKPAADKLEKKRVYLANLKKRLSGVNASGFGAHLLRNEIARLENNATSELDQVKLDNYANYIRKQLGAFNPEGILARLARHELALIQAGQFKGMTATPITGIGRKGKGKKKLKKFFKKVTQGLKKVSLAPSRNAFLALVKLNFRGLAIKLNKSVKRQPGKLQKLWERFGGRFQNLQTAINIGLRQKPLLGKKKGLSGTTIYDTPVLINGIGVEPATTATAGATLAAAAPIIAAVTALLKGLLKSKEEKDAEAKEIDPDTGEELETKGGKVVETLKDLAGTAMSLATAAGKPTEVGENFQVTDVEEGAAAGAGAPTGDEEIERTATGTSTMNLTPILIGGAALAAILLLRKK